MSDPSPPLPEIPLAEATGEVRAIYDAISVALGVRLVNLVYRHLATVPGALEWAWGVVGGPFMSGAFAAESAHVLAPLRDAAAGAEPIALSAAGLSAAEREVVAATLDAYNRANPMNAVSLEVVAMALADGRPASPPPAPAAAGGALPALLPIEPLDGLPAATRRRLDVLAAQATGGRARIVPSLFRHFARWPALLDAISGWLGAVVEDGAVDERSAEVLTAARAAAARIYGGLPAPEPSATVPDARTRAALGETVAVFPPAICRMIVIGTLLRSAIRR